MCIPNAEHGPAVEHLVGERLQPAKQRGLLSILTHCRPCPLDEVRRSLEILGGQRVADSIGRRTVLFVPLACAPMQGRYLIGPLLYQMRKEDFGEEVVVAIPVAPVIQRNDEEIAPLQGLQPSVAFFLASDGIAQRTTQPLENRGLE